MKNFNKNLIITALALSFVLNFGSTAVLAAATTPALGVAKTFGILAGTYTNTTAGTTITGDVGYTTGPAVVPTINGTTYVANATYNQAGTAQGAALTALNNETCTVNFAAGAIDLATDVTHGTVGVYTPGVYCVTGAMSVGTGGITLDGAGTYIFRSTGALTTVTGSVVATSNGASECDLFWTPGAATTLAANTTFLGTDIDAAGITIGSTVGWTGRALAYGGTISTASDTITVPTCAGAATTGTINVVKTIINDNGRTKVIADFPLLVNGASVTSGETNVFTAPATYTVTETTDSNYTQTFSASCPNGIISLVPSDTTVCTITNDDKPISNGTGAGPATVVVPPLIDVVKVPSPLALPGGPGLVTYAYTLRNVGTVPVTNITMIGDSCSPITLVSGDTNGDSKLDTTETWTYSCATTLLTTHTNTVTATGWANGISASDVASATVIVGTSAVPPLIHVTKIPNPIALLSGGGLITYTERITNPGTVALSNVTLTDDKCSPMQYISGDTNGDSKLDTTETWTYTCAKNLMQTTTNTATATGQANGLTAKDFAIATVVVVAAPTLPNTGVPPTAQNILWAVMITATLLLISTSVALAVKKHKI